MCLRKGYNTKGITLIEMLIAMTLLSIILAALGGTYFQSNRFTKQIEQKIEYRKKLRNLKTLLIRDISNAVFLNNAIAREQPKDPIYNTGIIGKRGQVESPRFDQIFMHVNNDSLYHSELEPFRDPEVHEVGYFMGITENDRVYKLYRREDYYVDSKFDFPDQNPYKSEEYLDTNKSITHFLVDDILSFEVKYLENDSIPFDPENPDNGWVDVWNSSGNLPIGKRLPYAVRITVKFPVIPPEEIADMTEFNIDDENLVNTETFEIIIRWKLDANFQWKY